MHPAMDLFQTLLCCGSLEARLGARHVHFHLLDDHAVRQVVEDDKRRIDEEYPDEQTGRVSYALCVKTGI